MSTEDKMKEALRMHAEGNVDMARRLSALEAKLAAKERELEAALEKSEKFSDDCEHWASDYKARGERLSTEVKLRKDVERELAEAKEEAAISESMRRLASGRANFNASRASALQRDLDAALALLDTVPHKIGFAESMIDRMNPQREKFSAWGDDFIRKLGALKPRPATAAGEEAKGRREEPDAGWQELIFDLPKIPADEASMQMWERAAHYWKKAHDDLKAKGQPAPESPWRALCMEVDVRAFQTSDGEGLKASVGGDWLTRRAALEAAEAGEGGAS